MPLSFNGYQTQSVRFQQDLEAAPSDVLGATARQTITELPIPSVVRMAELGNAQLTGQRIDAASARQRIADAGLQGRLSVSDEGMTSEALNILIERKRNEIKRQEVLSRSPGGFAMGAARLGTAFAASLMDPLNVGLAFVPVVGEARYMRYLANARGVLGRTAVRAGVGAAEGAVGAALVEPLVYAAKTHEQADYDFTDSLLNVAFGTVFGGGLHAVAGGVGDAARAVRPRVEPNTSAGRIDAMTVAEREAPLRTAVAQAMEGRQVEIEPVLPRVPDEERVIQSEVSARMAAREAELQQVIQSQDAFVVTASGDAQNVMGELQRSIELRDQIASEIAALPSGSERMSELIRQQARAQEIVDQRQQRANRLNKVRSAEADLEQLRYARSSAQSLDDLVDALPSSQQAGFRQRIERGRQSGDVRVRGARLAAPAELERPARTASEVRAVAERQASPEAQVTADVRASAAADQQLTEAPPTVDVIAEHEQAITDQLAELKDTARIAGIDLTDELAEIDELIAQAETYGKAARAAALCGLSH